MRLNRRASLAVVSGIGLVLTGVLLFDVYEDWAVQGNALVTTVVENALPFALLVGLFYSMWQLRGEDDAFVGLVTKWTVAGVVTMGGLTAWVVGIQVVQNELKPAIIVLQTTVVGAAAGLLVGQRTATVERARDEAEREKARFQSLFENDPAGIAALRLDGGRDDGDRLVVESANPRFESLFAPSSGGTLGEAVPGLDASVVATLRERVSDDARFTTEATLETEDGRRHFVVELVPFDEGAVEGTRSYAIFQDVTDLKEAEGELERTVEQLERSNEQLQQFAYVASHDLQEPLRMVSSYVDLLASEYGDELDDEADEYIEFAVDGAQRMQAMIDDLLQYSRVHTQGEAFEETDTEAVLERVLRDLELLLSETDATVTYDDLPSVVADENQLGQLLQNLVSNAVEHADDGDPPTVHVGGEERADGVVLSIADDGPGIPPDQQEKVFELFEQSSRDDDGTGIGLAICQRIVNRHEGDIWIESDEGEGTTFYVRFPDRSPQQSNPRGRKD
ncbi:sensor histidine kinase [Haloplanus halophilus]|uniref:sensor histidine kinase n=1 Tax=Haloplanus halophilus TaxID=2949993 RepID=UPI002041A442|nr:ATP-binding protein [Haloplanus sp. GDY1]